MQRGTKRPQTNLVSETMKKWLTTSLKKEDVLLVEEEFIPVLSTGIKLLRLLSQLHFLSVGILQR
jgi:hypothetical protein